MGMVGDNGYEEVNRKGHDMNKRNLLEFEDIS